MLYRHIGALCNPPGGFVQSRLRYCISRIGLDAAGNGSLDGIDRCEDVHHTDQDLPNCEDGRRHIVYLGKLTVVKTG